jgi:hypothetical protein
VIEDGQRKGKAGRKMHRKGQRGNGTKARRR